MALSTPSATLWHAVPVALSVTASDSSDAIRQTAALWSDTAPPGALPGLVDAILAREAIMSTALPGGVALPHARSSALVEPLAAIVRLTQPVDFAGSPVWLIAALASPASQPAVHLELLHSLSRVLSDPEQVLRLQHAVSAGEVRALFIG